jgi:hypothetical protein
MAASLDPVHERATEGRSAYLQLVYSGGDLPALDVTESEIPLSGLIGQVDLPHSTSISPAL